MTNFHNWRNDLSFSVKGREWREELNRIKEVLIMKYQLIIQFPEALYDDLDWIADLEDKLNEVLLDAEVDGHDIGSGEVNIFIHANDPVNSFRIAKSILEDDGVELNNIKAAYRKLNGEHYIPLWPENLVDFTVM